MLDEDLISGFTLNAISNLISLFDFSSCLSSKNIIRRNMGYKFESLDTCIMARIILNDDEKAVKKI